MVSAHYQLNKTIRFMIAFLGIPGAIALGNYLIDVKFYMKEPETKLQNFFYKLDIHDFDDVIIIILLLIGFLLLIFIIFFVIYILIHGIPQ
jgi:hypothetical protein